MSKSLVAVTYEHKSVLDQAQADLQHLANAAYDLGQDRLSDRLIAIGRRIVRSGQEVLDTHGAEISAQLTEDQKAFAATLRAALEQPGAG
jgi:hypothetical protein